MTSTIPPTATPSPSATINLTPTASSTILASISPTATATITATATPPLTDTVIPTDTAIPSATPTGRVACVAAGAASTLVVTTVSRVVAGQTLTVGVASGARLPLRMSLRVGSIEVTQASGTTDSGGQFTAHLLVRYAATKPVAATLDVFITTPIVGNGCSPLRRDVSVTIAPRGTRLPRPPRGPQLLRDVPAEAFPIHHGAGDRRFGVVEALAVPTRADALGLGWERVQIRWDELQPLGPLQWNANATQGAPPYNHPDAPFDHEIAQGRQLVGVIQGIPVWAAQTPGQGNAAVPKNLDLPWNDPSNYWGQFVFRAARHYAGRIDTLVILNEVNIATGPYRQFAGTPQQYAQMLRVAYLAAHAANPRVAIHIYGDSVFADGGAWFSRTLDALARFPDARANGYFFDAAEVHLYNTIVNWDSLIARWHALMRARGFDRPIWLSETNVAPRDDYVSPAFAADHNIPLVQQPNFIVASFATALGLGMPREEVYQMLDPKKIWPEHPYGLVRRDGSLRPEYLAVKTVATWFAGVTAARYTPGGEPYADRKPVFRVTMERPGQQIDVLWNQSGRDASATIAAIARSATVVRSNGATSVVRASGGHLTLRLGAATDHSIVNANLYIVGGPPLIVVQDLPRGSHVAGLHALADESDRSAGAGSALGPVSAVAVAPDGSGVRAIADTAHDRVLVLDAQGHLVARIGGTGGAPGRFRGPSGAAIGADGTLYVADIGNARIQEFDLAGHLLGGFGAYEAGAASLKAPTSIAVAPDGTLFVVDTAQDAVLRFTRMGLFLGRWGAPGYGSGQFDGPGGIAIDRDGRVYVADTLNNRVVEFDQQGHPLAQFGSGSPGADGDSLHWPTAVTPLDGGGLAIADAANGRVVVITQPETYLGGVALPGIGTPGGLAIASDGSYYVSDTTNNRIVHLAASGRYLGAFGSRGFGQGQYFQPLGLAFGSDGNLYVADSGNNRIEVVTAQGRFVRHIGRQGSAPGQFVGPHAVSVAPDGTLWVADTFNARIQHLTAAGGVIAIPLTHINGAWGVASDGRDGVYYSARWGQRVYHWTIAGQQVWGAPGSGAGEFDHPSAVVASPDGGVLYAVDEGNARVQIVRGGKVSGQRGGANPGEAGLGLPVAVAVAPDGSIAVLDAARLRIARYKGAAAVPNGVVNKNAIAVPGIPLSLSDDGAGGIAIAVYGPWSGITTQQNLAFSATSLSS